MTTHEKFTMNEKDRKLPGNVASSSLFFLRRNFPRFFPFTILCDRPRTSKTLPFDDVVKKMRMLEQCFCFDIFNACTNRIFLDCVGNRMSELL
jgi:hypothetical protein